MNLDELTAVKREAARVAAAFGVEEWEIEEVGEGWDCEGFAQGFGVTWLVGREGLELLDIWLNGRWADRLMFGTRGWEIYRNGDKSEFFARGLFRLGFSDESILAQLPPLSAHEQMEARLSLPRQFWPAKWLEEEKMREPAP